MIVDNVSKNVAGVILAGGLASRMGGGDKSLKSLGKKTILESVMDRLSSQVTTIVLNANGDPRRFSKYKIPLLRVINICLSSSLEMPTILEDKSLGDLLSKTTSPFTIL